MIYTFCLSILGKKNLRFLVSNFLLFALNRFAMLHIFYKQLKSNFHIKGCLVLFV